MCGCNTTSSYVCHYHRERIAKLRNMRSQAARSNDTSTAAQCDEALNQYGWKADATAERAVKGEPS